MQINVKVKTQAKENKIIKEKNGLKVWVNAPAEKGKANQEVIKTLSKHFSVPKSSIKIIKGHKNQNKIIKIEVNHANNF